MAADVYNDSRSWQGGYNLHQLRGNKEYGSEKKGYLLKKSNGIWKVWQRRKCAVQNGTLTISHARSNRQPAELNLLTCQVKPNAKGKKSFDVISHNRMYHFKAKDEQDCIAWVSVLTNSKEEALTVFFRGEQSTGEESLDSLTNAIIEDVQRLPGNDVCCDCGSSEPTWLSTNLGILICIECSGIHREMGVHISRIQSLKLDKLGTSELLLAKNVGNNRFNDIMEANLPSSSLKPNPSSDVTVRKDYIVAKYIDHRFARKTCSSSSAKLSELLKAIRSRDLLALIQAYAEGVELMEPLLDPGQELGETALHHAVRSADRTSLHLVYFLVQNSGNLNKQTALGNTVLHYCSMYGKPQCLKLLLRRKPMVDVVNQAGETALDIAKRLKATQCEDLLSQAKAGKFNPHVHVEYEWNLQRENMDQSNEELDNKSPIKKEHSRRPQSCGPSSSTSPQDKLSLLGFCTPREKQQLSGGTFTSQISASTSADFPTSPTSDGPLQRNLRDFFGPEFVKMTMEPFISLDVPRSTLRKKGKNEEKRRKLNIMLLSGQRLEVTCDTKTICKDVFDMVVAHIGLLEHHLFSLATLKDNEYFFVDLDLKLTKVAPEGWKEEPKKKNIAMVNFTLFFRIQFFMDDVSLIQYSLTCHQYYLQLRKDILEERMYCDHDTSLLLASLALQAEYGDYQAEVHGISYFRLEHYLPPRVMEKLDLSYIEEELPKLHNTYVGDSKNQTEFEFVKVCQRVTGYGVHLHRVRPEKTSQPGIVLGVGSKGVLVFEVHSGVRTLVHRSPWKDTKEISFSKKKFTLQSTSDGIKHAFQMDSSKVCKYLLHLCSSQLEFELQMRARQRNRDAQETVPSTPVHIASGMKNDMQKLSYVQDSAKDSSEDHRWPRGTPSHSSESSLVLPGGLREGSLSSQDSRAESASWSQRQVSGFSASHVGDRTWQESQHDSPSSPSVISKASEKKRASDSNQSKAKKPGISDATDSSDRGDSDMDEAIYSSSQDHQTPEKESSSSMNTSNKMNFKTFPSSPPKPGDIFEVEMAKDDDSLGKSVTDAFGPEFAKMMVEPFISLDVPRSTLRKKGKNEESRRKLNIMLLSGQRLEVTCDTKTICKDVFDTVVAHIGLLEHHLFSLATLKDNEYFFVDLDLKLTKVAPEGWKEEPKKKNIAMVNFTLFFRIQFFMDDVSLIQYSLTCHQYYLQLRKDILEERMYCDHDTSLLLASLALQAEYGDYQAEVHGISYFRLEHYLPPRVMEKLDLSYMEEELPKLHNTYVGDSKNETEFEFVKVCQRVTGYGVHLHRVRPEETSQPGIVLGVGSKGVFLFEVHSGVRTLVLRSPWKDIKQISFSKKEFTLQNTSDGIKHAFQMDSSKVCKYLLHLCSSQLEFELQMRARQRNRDAQETVPSTPVHIASGMKNDMQKLSYVQDSAIDSSEDHRWPCGTPSHSSESSLVLPGGLREGSLSSQDSRAESDSWSQRQVSGFSASHVGDRTWQESQHDSPSSPSVISKASEKKRASDSNQSKAKKPGISDATDSSDRGDSDMDEAIYSSSQDHRTPEKESSSSMNTSNTMNFKTFPSSPPKPGDIFEVEMAKDDDSLGKSVTDAFGPEFAKMMVEPFISLDVPRSTLRKKGKNEESRRKLNIMLLSGQRLEVTCDTKTICKDVFDTVVAHIGLLEHHLFSLATLKDNEYFFVDLDLKLTKVAPEGWKEEPKKKNIAMVNFTLFFRIQFFMDDVSLIQYSLTCHQYYLQLRKDILEERMYCDHDTSLLLASLALQAEYGDYQAEVHGISYFRLEHYLPPRVMEKLDLSYMEEELPKLHNTYVGDSKNETEFEFVKVCQRVTEYGVHLHRVRPEKTSQPGTVLGVGSKGVLVFEVHSGVRTLVLRLPWKDIKQISFSKKKFTLQNTSDGIKHAFQMENSNLCHYLLQLCFSQLEFEPQMRARQRNRDAQETVPSTPVHIASGMKNDMQKPSYVQDSAIDSSEDHRWPCGTPSHSSESSFGLSGSLLEGSQSSQDSRAESASWSQRQVSGFSASHVGDRTWQESQHDSPSSPSVISKASEKKRASDSNQSKAKKPGISDATDSSDRGDSDMDEAIYSSSQDHRTPEKESSSSMNTPNKMNFKTFPSSPPKPGDIFEVEMAKDDDSLGKSVTDAFGPEFVKMTMEPFISLDVPRSTLRKKGKNEEKQRKLNIMLLSGQRLEVTCDTKTICKDVFDTVVAHIGLLEHHLFSLATLKDNEYFFVDPDLKLTEVAPEGWKEEPKKKNIAMVNFTLFFRIQFFMDDVSLIQYSLTCHQYYLQLRKDILEERMYCDHDTSLLLASLALQAEYGDYQPEGHGVSYFRLEHYLPPRVMEELDLSYIKEELPKLHNTYVGDSKNKTEVEFVKDAFGPEFVKMTMEPFISLDVPRSTLRKKGKNEEKQRKLNIMLLSGQRLEVTCDTKTICKDVFDTVVAHIGLLEHHLFSLATLKDNEYFFVDPDLKLTEVAPEGWKEEPKKKNIAMVNFTLFFRIQFFMDDVSLIQYSLTCHQYYLQLRKDILEERMYCDHDTSLLLASLALQAEYGDYQPEGHGVSYFRLEHYLPPRVMEELDLSYIKEELPKLHNTYVGDSKNKTEFEFVKVCQRVTEYGVHLHRVLPEKTSQPGIVLGVGSKGVLVFEVHSGVRILVHRSPWKDIKQITFSKKKFTLQSTSDGIKHAFQMDSSKVCQYLLHLCSSQLEFEPQIRVRQRNRDAQETGDCVLAVNGVSLEGATHKQAVETLRNTGQLVHRLLEKGQSPASNGPVPITPQCSLLDPDAQGQGPEKMMKKMTSVKDYSFVAEENTFEVKLFKNSSGLGFSFSREENLMNASIVRVKKLFPGHPAAESGKIDVGDVILKVNGASLKGLSQLEVIWALRRTSPEVSLLLCRPPPGVLPEMDPALLTPLHSPAQELPNSSKDTSQPACVEPGSSSDVNKMSDKSKKPCTSPSWRDSCSDSSGSGEEDVVKAPAKIPKSDVQKNDFHDDPQEAEFIQSLLDVVDDEARNLLIQNNVARDTSVPGALKTNARISEEREEDRDCDGSPLPEDFTESTKMNGYEEYCEERVKSESLIQKS